ncbi:Hypothetical protein CpMEX30_0068 [Corynebacterium pseudotuberculosis]|nr:Hypothetical protein Cp3995_0054 [Corynebacterium pseudotuberculosis 3/99-5]AFH50970.1 Hypothetical protein Cp267_0061 [Corynebacterium pseudotuberculosis 267]AIG06406.1 hypothetical protein CPTA_00577 [Corynebacterium pseudotuberculosis]AIG09011.1 hypothetical protein CPTB_00955 [Corynebacterium pseudotuberculosis]AIG10905.1 hypothetical protein CPTC_00617 [Corynebacterium pseudotuberculosis]
MFLYVLLYFSFNNLLGARHLLVATMRGGSLRTHDATTMAAMVQCTSRY